MGIATLEIVTVLKETMLNDHDDGVSRASVDANAHRIGVRANESVSSRHFSRHEYARGVHHHVNVHGHEPVLDEYEGAHVCRERPRTRKSLSTTQMRNGIQTGFLREKMLKVRLRKRGWLKISSGFGMHRFVARI